MSLSGVFVMPSACDHYRSYLHFLDCFLLQVITLDHEKYESGLNNIATSFLKSRNTQGLHLRSVGVKSATGDLKARLPKVYHSVDCLPGMLLNQFIPLAERAVHDLSTSSSSNSKLFKSPLLACLTVLP